LTLLWPSPEQATPSQYVVALIPVNLLLLLLLHGAT
jgi:hypothetical protein